MFFHCPRAFTVLAAVTARTLGSFCVPLTTSSRDPRPVLPAGPGPRSVPELFPIHPLEDRRRVSHRQLLVTARRHGGDTHPGINTAKVAESSPYKREQGTDSSGDISVARSGSGRKPKETPRFPSIVSLSHYSFLLEQCPGSFISV